MQPTERVLSRGRGPRSAIPILLAIISVTAQMLALAALTGIVAPAPNKAANPLMASALLHGIDCGQSAKSCQTAPASPLAGDNQEAERIEVPSGAAPCPSSGAGASCGQAAAITQPGAPTLPAGASACPDDSSKPVPAAPGACSDVPVNSNPDGANGTPGTPEPANPTITLSADRNVLAGGMTAILEARSNISMTGTPWAIEIFDITGKVLVGVCAQSSSCTVDYTGGLGRRTFVAYVMTPGWKVPAGAEPAISNALEVRWLGAWIAATDPTIVAPHKSITFTATASEDVGRIGYRIELRDAVSGQRLTFCSHGTTCSMSLIEPVAGTRSVVAQLAAQSPAAQAATASLDLTSASASGTWLGVELLSSPAGVQGGDLSLTAIANADLSHTPWSIYFQSERGEIVGTPCNASTCSTRITVGSQDNRRYRALIGRMVPDPAAKGPLASVLHVATAQIDVAAASPFMRPSRVLWGVDSCQPFTNDPTGSSGLLPQVMSTLGYPDFWGRYLPSTTYCPGLSAAEISAARSHHMGILPIYNDYDCSAVSGYSVGSSYALSAATVARADGIPTGTAIAIDIEPPGDACPGAANVDAGFVEGWFDTIAHWGFVPVYYGNSTFASPFMAAWCDAVGARPEIASNSFVWSFEPSLQGSQLRALAPTYMPNPSGCAGYTTAWQYQLSAGSTPNVDTDEANSAFPFWWP